MIDVGVEFVHVRNESGTPDEGHLRSRVTDLVLPHGPFRVAVDFRAHKHALFPVGDEEPHVEERTAAVVLRTRELVVDGRRSRFVDLECTEPGLDLVFEHLVTDVLERVSADDSAPALACAGALGDWRDLLRSQGAGTSREVALGLTGELEALSLLGAAVPARALAAWCGPSGGTHDFVSGGRHLEVKSTATVDGQSIRVSNIDQLDPDTAPDGLHLLVFHCAADETAPTIDHRVRDLISRGFPRTPLIRAVARAGHLFESGHDVPSFNIRSARLWVVDEAFPGLRARDIPGQKRAAVTRIRYELSLAGAVDPLAETEMEEVLASWCDT